MQQTTRSYLIKFVATSAVLLFFFILLYGVHSIDKPVSQPDHPAEIESYYIPIQNGMNSHNRRELQELNFEEDLPQQSKLWVYVSEDTAGEVNAPDRLISEFSQYHLPVIENNTIACLNSVFLLM